MKIELITQKDFQEKYYLQTENGTFTPDYVYEDFVNGYDEETGEIINEYYVNLVIHKTAQEVYDEWLYNKDNPPEPTPTVEEKVDAIIPVVEYHDEDIQFQGEISLDIDYRLTLVEMNLGASLRTRIGDDEMSAKPNSTTYRNAKKQIERGNYEYEEMLIMLDTFLLGNRITQEEYIELKDLMDSQQK